jgi:hypothetical protein
MQDPFSPVQVIGSGELSPSQRRKLTAVERRNSMSRRRYFFLLERKEYEHADPPMPSLTPSY